MFLHDTIILACTFGWIALFTGVMLLVAEAKAQGGPES